MQEGDNPSTPDPAPAKPSGGHVISIHPPLGEVPPIVKSEAEKASLAGRQLVVYVGATWCEPCQRFHHALERGELDETFPKLTVIEFDLDHDAERLKQAGYASRFIPLFALPKPDGTASFKKVEGGIKGEGAVSFVSGKLKELLAQN
jgi:thiol-disulfide isomerase/thioredoxin